MSVHENVSNIDYYEHIAIGNFFTDIAIYRSKRETRANRLFMKGWYLPSANAKVTAKALKRQASTFMESLILAQDERWRRA